MNPQAALGPDGLSVLFYTTYWDSLGQDIILFVQAFFNDTVDLAKLNQTHIALIPKTQNPTTVPDFRPISLCNVVYKIIAKILSNRLKPHLSTIISPFQPAFLPGGSHL
jgi:hypothetical protein